MRTRKTREDMADEHFRCSADGRINKSFLNKNHKKGDGNLVRWVPLFTYAKSTVT